MTDDVYRPKRYPEDRVISGSFWSGDGIDIWAPPVSRVSKNFSDPSDVLPLSEEEIVWCREYLAIQGVMQDGKLLDYTDRFRNANLEPTVIDIAVLRKEKTNLEDYPPRKSEAHKAFDQVHAMLHGIGALTSKAPEVTVRRITVQLELEFRHDSPVDDAA